MQTESKITVNDFDMIADAVIKERTTHNNTRTVAAIEVKWWRDADQSNASNRRKALVRDIIRAASMSNAVESFALVCLVATYESWDKTLNAKSEERNFINSIATSNDVVKVDPTRDLKSILKTLLGSNGQRFPIPTSIHVERQSECCISLNGNESVVARIWEVRKPQRSGWL